MTSILNRKAIERLEADMTDHSDEHKPGGSAFVSGRVEGYCYCGECLSFRSFSEQYEGVDYEAQAYKKQCRDCKPDHEDDPIDWSAEDRYLEVGTLTAKDGHGRPLHTWTIINEPPNPEMWERVRETMGEVAEPKPYTRLPARSGYANEKRTEAAIRWACKAVTRPFQPDDHCNGLPQSTEDEIVELVAKYLEGDK